MVTISPFFFNYSIVVFTFLSFILLLEMLMIRNRDILDLFSSRTVKASSFSWLKARLRLVTEGM